MEMVHSVSICRPRSGLRSSFTSSIDYSLTRRHTKFSERAFLHAGPSTCNTLHDNICATADPAKFQQQLKSHILVLLLTFTGTDFVMHLCSILCNRRTINLLVMMMIINGFVRSWHHLIHGLLDPHESTSKMTPRSVQLFLHGSRTRPTDRHTQTRRQTDHATPYVVIALIWCNARIAAVHCGLKWIDYSTIHCCSAKETKFEPTTYYQNKQRPRLHLY